MKKCMGTFMSSLNSRPIVQETIQPPNKMELQCISKECLTSILRKLQESQSIQEQDNLSIDSVGSGEQLSIDQHDDDLLCTVDTPHPSWTEEMLVEELRHMRCLWDTSCRAYKDGLRKQQAWRDICSKFGVQGQGM